MSKTLLFEKLSIVLNFDIRISNFPVRSTRRATHFPKLRVVFLPSSLRICLSIVLGCSPSPPVSVCGTAFSNSRYEYFPVGWSIRNRPPRGELCTTSIKRPDGFSNQNYFGFCILHLHRRTPKLLPSQSLAINELKEILEFWPIIHRLRHTASP